MHSLLRFLLGSTFHPDVANWIVLVADLVSLGTIPSVLVRRNGRPLAALSWILALLILPIFGVLAWWLLGRTHLQRKMRARRAASVRACDDCPPVARQPGELPEKLRHVLPFALEGRRWMEGVFPPAVATEVSVLADGRKAFAAMEETVANARSEIRALFYEWNVDTTGRRLASLLMDRARAGVKVRVLVDQVGSRKFTRALARDMRDSGVEVGVFLPGRLRTWAPTFNFRNHRKLLLVDGAIAFTGGMNIGASYEHDWRDLMVRFGGAVVRNFDDVFREDWAFARNELLEAIAGVGFAHAAHAAGLCTVIASGPDRTENRVHDAFFLAIAGARHRVWLTSPYFVPSPSIVGALRSAAQRGVDVRILLPRRSDVPLVALAARSYYRHLVREGVRVFEYQPRFLHAKSLLVDDELAVVGSANADTRSFRLNFELCCFVLAGDLNADLAALFEQNQGESVEIGREALERKSVRTVCLESAAHLMSPLL